LSARYTPAAKQPTERVFLVIIIVDVSASAVVAVELYNSARTPLSQRRKQTPLSCAPSPPPPPPRQFISRPPSNEINYCVRSAAHMNGCTCAFLGDALRNLISQPLKVVFTILGKL